MMAGVTRILTFICFAGCHLSSASPVLRSALVVQSGQNASLTCNLTSCMHITWYFLRSDQLLPVLSVTPTKVKDVTVAVHAADVSRFNSRGNMERDPVRLEITEVEEKDGGLYFCTSWCGGHVSVSRGIHLVVDGIDGDSARQPCWGLEICVLPSLLVLCFVFIVGFCLHSGKPAVCCCNPVRNTEEVTLHYSSLKHAAKPRPSDRAGTRLAEEDVIYSAVTGRKNPNRSHDRR